MSITLGAADRRKPGVDEGSGMVLSGGSFEVNLVGNIDFVGPGEGYPIRNSEVILFGSKLGIYGGEVMGITFGVADRSKLGSY